MQVFGLHGCNETTPGLNEIHILMPYGGIHDLSDLHVQNKIQAQPASCF